jgi:UDP-GlcNAc:undecaprenyl-phosphate/decaprenyl-phosphate GlcNAc-1-phosphate transferase
VREYLLTLVIAAALTYLITPWIQKLAIKARAVAKVRERDVHSESTPRWGGFAMWIAFAGTLLIVNNLNLVGKSFTRELLGVFLAATLLVFIGVLDDRYELDAITKLAGQSLAAGLLLFFGIQILWIPINGILILPTNIGQFLTVLVVVITINAVNFVDGLDGLASGIVAISAASLFGFAYLLAVVNEFPRAGAPSLVSAIAIGLCLGFLPHNFFPAKIFMGDSGSMLLGLMLAASAITLSSQIDVNAAFSESLIPALLPIFLPFMVLAIPLLDFLLAVIRRSRAGKSPFAPDKKHIHHKLMELGNSQQRATVVLYLWTAMLALPTMASAFLPLWQASLIGVALLIASILVNKSKLDFTTKRVKIDF